MSDFREDAIEIIKSLHYEGGNIFYEMGYTSAINKCVEVLQKLPVSKGKWMVVEYNDGSVRTECSVCGYGKDLPPVRHYCPNCGVKMERS